MGNDLNMRGDGHTPDLIERVEGAAEGSRELDMEITVALDLRPDWLNRAGGELWIDRSGWQPVVRFADDAIGRSRGNPPLDYIEAYSTSMDAVLTLIDPADEWELSTIYNVARATVGLNRDHQASWPGYGEHKGGDPVLALLSASLKARAIP